MSDDAIQFDDLKRRMTGALAAFKTELQGLRTGRASSSLVEPIVAEAYGGQMPIAQLATVSVPEPRMISIQVWDRSTVQAVEKALRNSSLGLNPVVEGVSIRLPIPELNAERRQELVKVAHKYAEGARVAIRHVRRDGMDSLKKAEKDGLSEDLQRQLSDKVQKLTDEMIADVDKMLASKEAEITQV